MVVVAKETAEGVREGITRAYDDYLEVLVLRPGEARIIAQRETYAIIRGSLPPTPKELIERFPRLPTPLELIPKLEDVFPTPEDMRESIKQMVPTPKNIAEGILEIVSPAEKLETVAIIVTPGAIIIGGVIIAIALFLRPPV